MTLQVVKPYISVTDENGLPYVGAQLYVYVTNTTTLAPVFTDDGLSIPADNPATSDARGDFPRLFIAAGTYKLRAERSNGMLIFEEDDIDTGLSAGTGALPINRGGTGATTAAAARANLDVPSNSELAALSSTIADIQTALQGVVSQPQGRLTLTSGAAVPTADVIAATAIYYTPVVGQLIPIWDGTQYNPKVFAELTLTLNSNHLASTIYDVFAALDSGVVVIGTGTAWNNSAAGAGSRGSGGGTTELERVNGLWVNKNAITLRNGATLYSIAARLATYLGSAFMDGSAGQITCHRSYGQSRKWGPWNAYNRQPILLKAGDGTASWSYNTVGVRPSNNAAANSLTVFSGLAEETYDLRFTQRIDQTSNAASAAQASNAIGFNSTSGQSGKVGVVGNTPGASESQRVVGDGKAEYIAAPSIGINTVTALETMLTAGNSTTWNGTETNMLLAAQWRG